MGKSTPFPGCVADASPEDDNVNLQNKNMKLASLSCSAGTEATVQVKSSPPMLHVWHVVLTGSLGLG